MTRKAHVGNRARRGISTASARGFSVENQFICIRKFITMSQEWNLLGKNCFLINRKTNNYVGGIEN